MYICLCRKPQWQWVTLTIRLVKAHNENVNGAREYRRNMKNKLLKSIIINQKKFFNSIVVDMISPIDKSGEVILIYICTPKTLPLDYVPFSAFLRLFWRTNKDVNPAEFLRIISEFVLVL